MTALVSQAAHPLLQSENTRIQFLFRAAAEDFMSARRHRPESWRRVAALAVLAALVLPVTSCATNPVTGKNEFTLMSESEEIRVGGEADKELRAQMGVYGDPALQQYVTDVGMRLAASGQRPGLPWHFAVVDQADINAFALPGGYVYITRGLLAYLDTEAEMAGVLGHEIGHVNARHSAQGYTRSVTLMGGAALASILFPKAAPYAAGGAAGLSVLFLKYDRNQELQADRLGAEYAAKVGWTPLGMPGVLEVLSRLEAGTGKGGVPNWLSTHPRSDDRLARVDPSVQALLAAAPAAGWVENRDRYLRRVDGLVFGDDPREGLVRGNVFVHPDLRFQVAFPDGWTIDNGKTEVVATAPGDQKAAMVLRLVDQPASASLEDAAAEAMRKDGFELLRGDRSTVHGLPAFLGTYEATVEDVGIVRMQAAHVAIDGRLVMVGGMTPRSQYSTQRDTFASSIATFAPIGREDAARIRPNRLGFATVREGETWESIAKRTGGLIKPRALAILNDVAPETPPVAGRRVKVVVAGR